MIKLKSSYGLYVAFLIAACSAPKKDTSEATNAEEEKPVNVVGTDITYAADTIEMKGYFSYDANNTTKRPGVLVIHEWWGHNEYSRERADMLAELGYIALAVDMYGDGKVAEHPEDAGKFAGMVMSNLEVAKSKFESALATLKNHPNVDKEKIGAIGYCFGGSVALSMANAGYDLDAVAAFHSGLGLPVMPDSGAVKAKILVANGADDPFIPEQQALDFKAAMDKAGADYKYVSYEGAVHAFTSKKADDLGEKFKLPLAYDAVADSASWEEMKILFATAF
ncbi:MAG: dienelactone hydrolase family protein [Bacteroidota bacterium]